MASNRATKSGIALEAQQKMASKWDPDRAKTAVAYIGQRIGQPMTTDGTMKDVCAQFKDGLKLGLLANWVRPGFIPAAKLSKAQTMAFKQMELIGLFLEAIDESKGGCVKKDELFQTVDLYEEVNPVQFIITIESLARAMLTCGREGYGKAESKGQHHEWTDEQLAAGKNIIGLQMGTNKGANQSGQNFGKSRGITD